MKANNLVYVPPKDERPTKPCIVCQAQIKAPYGWHRYGCTCSRSCEEAYPANTPEQRWIESQPQYQHPYGGK